MQEGMAKSHWDCQKLIGEVSDTFQSSMDRIDGVFLILAPIGFVPDENSGLKNGRHWVA